MAYDDALYHLEMKGKTMRDKDWILPAMFIACLAVVVLGFHAVRSYFEASAYERVTGQHVSIWDAMFLELRVQEGTTQPKDQP